MKPEDDLDRLLRDTLNQEVVQHAYLLEGLEDRIRSELAGRLPRAGLGDLFRRLLAPTRGARIAQLAVVGATAVVFLVLGVFLAEKVLPTGGESLRHAAVAAAGTTEEDVLFVMPAPDAKSVAVVGNFNNWSPTPLSDPDGDGIWTARIHLSPGRYEYAFVVDGHWWGQDPLADDYVRSFGQYNSVRYVGRAGEGA